MSPDEEIPRAHVVFPALVEVHFDGACQPPKGGGVATYGFTVRGAGLDHDDCGLAVRPWSAHATNNVAEYRAAIAALEYLHGRGFRGTVVMHGDSQLVIRQMQGEYEVRAEHLRSYHDRLKQLQAHFEEVRFAWIPREENAEADALSKRALEEEWRTAGRHRPVTSVVPAPGEDEDPSDAPSVPGPGR